MERAEHELRQFSKGYTVMSKPSPKPKHPATKLAYDRGLPILTARRIWKQERNRGKK